MPTFEHSIEIAAPIDRVFEWGTDPENWQRATPSMTDFEIIEETDDGMRLRSTYQLLGRSIENQMEFKILEPQTHTVTTFESPGMTGEMHYRFSETDTGTRVVQECEYEFGDSLLERIVEPVAIRYNKRQFKNSLQTTRDLLEAEVAVTAGTGTA